MKRSLADAIRLCNPLGKHSRDAQRRACAEIQTLLLDDTFRAFAVELSDRILCNIAKEDTDDDAVLLRIVSGVVAVGIHMGIEIGRVEQGAEPHK